MGDLIHSHDMYQEPRVQGRLQQHQSAPMAAGHDELPPISVYEQHATRVPQHHQPIPQHTRPVITASHQHPVPTVPQRAPSSYAFEQDRQAIEAMMREITHMQRRLSLMLSSCEALIERTHIMHEYHHIARYRTDTLMRSYPSYTVSPTPVYHHHGAPETTEAEQQIPTAPRIRPYDTPQMRASIHTSSAPPHHDVRQPTPVTESPQSVKEGVFDGTHMISADGDMYIIPTNFMTSEQLIEGDILQASIYANGHIVYTLTEPTAREHIMGILSTHSGTSPHYIVQTAHKAYKVLREAVEQIGATPGKQILLIVPAGGESEWASIERVFG